jgi:diguanylate cyclase (GGDEF)-like protein
MYQASGDRGPVVYSSNDTQPQQEARPRTLSIKVIAYASAIIIICLFLAIMAANLILTRDYFQEVNQKESLHSTTDMTRTIDLLEPSGDSLSNFLSLVLFNISAILLTVGIIAFLVRFMMRAMGMDFQQVKTLLNSLAEGEPLAEELPTPRLRETAEVYPAISHIHKTIDKKQQLLEHQELRDKLTGLSNRRQFNIEFARAYDFARRGTPVCVVLMHLTNLDKLNENQASQVVKILGKTLKEHARRVDHAARLDQADFALLMFGANPQSTTPCLERICRSFRKYQIEHPAIPEKFACSLDCGYTRIHAHRDSNAMEVLKRAETALAEAKHSPNHYIIRA